MISFGECRDESLTSQELGGRYLAFLRHLSTWIQTSVTGFEATTFAEVISISTLLGGDRSGIVGLNIGKVTFERVALEQSIASWLIARARSLSVLIVETLLEKKIDLFDYNISTMHKGYYQQNKITYKEAVKIFSCLGTCDILNSWNHARERSMGSRCAIVPWFESIKPIYIDLYVNVSLIHACMQSEGTRSRTQN